MGLYNCFPLANTHVVLFSWQEMAEYDIPAMVEYILDVTGNTELSYVGHSQGTLIAFAKFSSDIEFAKKV